MQDHQQQVQPSAVVEQVQAHVLVVRLQAHVRVVRLQALERPSVASDPHMQAVDDFVLALNQTVSLGEKGPAQVWLLHTSHLDPQGLR